MPGSSFGVLFKFTTYGESHGKAMGVVIEGCPPGITIDLEAIANDLARRKPGQSSITTQRKESEVFDVLSGLFEEKTTGTPLSFVVYNQDQNSKDYDHLKQVYRPSHADFSYEAKYGIRDYRGGGRSSARETLCRVIAGSVAKQVLAKEGVSIKAFVSQVGNIKLNKDYQELNIDDAENNIVRCPEATIAEKMIAYIKEIRKQGDTVGGQITCVIENTPAGLGEPVFDKLNADLAKAMLSINAVKGFDYGSGFAAVSMKGSEHNDVFVKDGDSIKTSQNNSGGIQGGISNGMDIYFNVAFKPVATLMKDQQTVNTAGIEQIIKGKGRHDPCVVPRAVPIVEAMAALVLVDHYLRQKAIK